MKKTKKSNVGAEIVESLREFVETLKSGADLESTFNCRRVDVKVDETTYDPELVRETRQLLRASQSVFGKFLGVSVKTVRAWEQGANVPSEIAKRFMDEIRYNPNYWRGRLNDLVKVKDRVAASA